MSKSQVCSKTPWTAKWEIDGEYLYSPRAIVKDADGNWTGLEASRVGDPYKPDEAHVALRENNLAHALAAVNATARINVSDLERGALEELINTARNTVADIRLFIAGGMGPDEYGNELSGTADVLEHVIQPFAEVE